MFDSPYGSFSIQFTSISVEGGVDNGNADLTLVCQKMSEVCSLFPYACDVTSTNAFDVLNNVCGISQQ